jgi:outer membrane protein OmpA-like peptidoglycan-associated protein
MKPNGALSRGTLTAVALTAFLLTGACGAAGTPQPLLDARASYETAASGPAGRLTPAELVDAKQALDEAEQSFEDDGASDETLDAAYIAQRRAQIANARGGIAEAEEAATLGRAELAMVQDARLQNAEFALTATQGEVDRKDRQLAATDAELKATDRALLSEQKGRAEAEHRAKEAMDKLALAASLAVKDEPRGTVITLPSNVLFATGKSELLPGARSKLDAVAVALKDQPDVDILVEGHTDSQGTPANNVQLAKRRGESVRAYIQSKGVPTGQLSSVGIGEGRPIGDNGTSDGRAQNRRVEIIVSPREKR